MKKTITKTIKINNLKKNYGLSGLTYTYPYGYEVSTNIQNYTFDIENKNKLNMLNNDLDKNIKNIRIVYEIEQEILDEGEKEYLSSVIKPFRNKVAYIQKCGTSNGDEYIWIELENDDVSLPYFKKNTMYKNMKEMKEYTLEELGL